MMTEEIAKLYDEEFPTTMTLDEVSGKLDTMKQHKHYCEFARFFCDTLVSVYTEGFVKYDLEKDILFANEKVRNLIFHNIERLDDDKFFYWAFYYFLKRNNKKCIDYINKLLLDNRDKNIKFMEGDILDLLLVPYKNAYKGFWGKIKQLLIETDLLLDEGIDDFIDLIDEYYNCNDDVIMVDKLTEFMRRHPDFKTPKEWLGYTYQSLKMWNNSIACFEGIEEGFYFPMDEVYFMLAWANGKVKNRSDEEEYYRKCLEIAPYKIYANNNLGYCLYCQKKYIEAKELFERCLSDDIDLDYVPNNYVRVLIALGRNKDAYDFIKTTKHKISKAMKDRVAKLDKNNKRLKKQDVIEDVVEEKEETGQLPEFGIKRQQFSNEKLLEDELTARIEMGMLVFGMNLKIYKRKGEYGRQYIIPIGRLDLLCEDNNGDLYIIELKKDSGYDDAYKQTAEYLEWFENSPKFKDKNIYGIICLNNPSKQLIEKVHNDKRMKIFEYQISYTER